MPTPVAQLRGRKASGIWALIGAVVAVAVLVNLTVVVLKAAAAVALIVGAGLLASWLADITS